MEKKQLLDLSYQHPIIVFDGVCNLCNSFINFLFKHDHNRIFRYATLQSEVAHEIVDPDADTVYLYENGVVYLYSDVAIEASKYLGKPYNYAYLLRYIPKKWRDLIYRWIAKNRYRIFGKKEVCMMPNYHQKNQFL